jgi:hypothetical protein
MNHGKDKEKKKSSTKKSINAKSVTEGGQLRMFASILEIMENYIIALIQHVLLMSGSESRDYCCHIAIHE